MLAAVDLTASYGAEPVLRDCSVGVESGEIFVVIGPSGVGKSTLLDVLALSKRPERGTVRVDGTDAWAVGRRERLPLRRRMGMVYQQTSLFDATVQRNVAYGLRVRRSWQQRIAETVRELVLSNRLAQWVRQGADRGCRGAATADGGRTAKGSAAVQEALSVVGMAEDAAQDAASLSGGEAQRVAFARALAYDPDVLLLDEPTSDLDPRNTAVIEEAMAAALDRDIGVVLATHDMHQANRVADRVAVLLGDGVVERGSPEQVFEDPADERTRQFVSGELVY